MGSFKTLEAFFRPVQKASHGDTEPAPRNPEQHDARTAPDASARPAPPRPAPPAPAAHRQPSLPPSKAPIVLSIPRPGASKDNLLAVMLHGRKALPMAEDATGPTAAAAPALLKPQLHGSEEGDPGLARRCDSDRDHPSRGRDHDASAAVLQRPPKRPCLEPSRGANGRGPSAAAATAPPLPPPLERRASVTCLLQARSTGRLGARRELWSASAPRLVQVSNWDGGLRLRPPSVIHQDAITQLDISTADGPAYARLAIAHANQLVRIVPYRVLRDLAEARRAAAREVEENTDADHDGYDGSDDDGGSTSYGTNRRARSSRQRHRALPLQPWDDLASCPGARCVSPAPTTRPSAPSYHLNGAVSGNGRSALTPGFGAGGGGGGSSSCVLTLNTRQNVAALGWDPRRPGRLAYVDRASPNVMLLDLGSTGGGRGQGSAFSRSHLTAASASSAGAFGGGGGGSAAARALTYMRYGSTAAPYTFAAAGRASGEGAVVHLWDERRGSAPVSRLACPGGAPLVAALESSSDGTALLGVVHPGTLVLWDVRRASSTACGGALMSLGASAPSPSSMVGSWELLGPLAAGGCWRPVVSSVSLDPRDDGRVALLTQDGSSALWSLRSAALTHACPAPPPPAAAVGGTTSSASAGAALVSTTAVIVPTPTTTTTTQLAPTAPGLVPVHVNHAQTPTPASVCAMVGALYGSWDADVCGFWHPAAVEAASGYGGTAASPRPSLALADFRRTTCRTAAPTAPGPTAVGEGTAAGPQGHPHRLASEAFDEWPVCVVCMPYTGDVVVGTLGGQLSYWWKA